MDEESECKQVLNPDRISKSSAYISEYILVPFGRTNGSSDSVFSNKYSQLSPSDHFS